MNSYLKSHKFILTILACVCLVSVLVLGGFTTSNAQTATASSCIVVSGEGSVYAKPDIATINLGVSSFHKSAKEAQTANATAMTAIMKAITGAGIAEKDIQTTNYSINPRYSYTDNKSTLDGYEVNNTVTVTVRDISKLGSVIDLAGQNGANQVNGIAFSVSDYDTYYQKALKLAVENAQGKAKALGEAAGISVGKPAQIAESGSVQPVVYQTQLMNKAMAADMASTPISTGEYKITALISVTYNY